MVKVKRPAGTKDAILCTVEPESRNIDRSVSRSCAAHCAMRSFGSTFEFMRALIASSVDEVMNLAERAPPRTFIASPEFSKYSISRRSVISETSGKSAPSSS